MFIAHSTPEYLLVNAFILQAMFQLICQCMCVFVHSVCFALLSPVFYKISLFVARGVYVTQLHFRADFTSLFSQQLFFALHAFSCGKKLSRTLSIFYCCCCCHLPSLFVARKSFALPRTQHIPN